MGRRGARRRLPTSTFSSFGPTGPARRLTSDPAEDLAAGWSPHGEKIIFTSDRNGRWQIFVMNLDRTHLRNLSGKRFDEFDPSWR
jgi:TolB protein